MAQLEYGYKLAPGVAGGLFDLSNYDVVARRNEEANGTMKFGYGVVTGTKAGTSVKLPVKASTAAQFEGITVYNANRELDTEGNNNLGKNSELSVMKYGKVWARVAPTATVAYGTQVALVTDGANAGTFTDAADATADLSKVAVQGRFVSEVSDGLAVIELVNSLNA